MGLTSAAIASAIAGRARRSQRTIEDYRTSGEDRPMSRLCWRWMFVLAIPALATQVSCGGSNTPTTTTSVNPATPAAIVAASSTTLTGIAGQPVSALPSVKVTSNSGAPISGAGVTFTVASGGGTI